MKVVFKHNHEIGPDYYNTYSFTKKITDEDVELLKYESRRLAKHEANINGCVMKQNKKRRLLANIC